LYQQALYGVNQAKVPVQENSGGTNEPMAASLTVLAKQAGMSRIDHVLLSEQRAGLKAGENVFVVEGNPGDPHAPVPGGFAQQQDLWGAVLHLPQVDGQVPPALRIYRHGVVKEVVTPRPCFHSRKTVNKAIDGG